MLAFRVRRDRDEVLVRPLLSRMVQEALAMAESNTITQDTLDAEDFDRPNLFHL